MFQHRSQPCPPRKTFGLTSLTRGDSSEPRPHLRLDYTPEYHEGSPRAPGHRDDDAVEAGMQTVIAAPQGSTPVRIATGYAPKVLPWLR
ncbi:hypothetical protein FA95DRAFT_1071450 [Auriscalpium vulgare]|uniref:Uncharacterized protein n=1 Tax=Auriscalpium vulgare TaxID=40419 RepID=A0ACB8RWV8_9AGAM|nr:hypothetical protein FA95DRAFT_1071450 [Auriscalpium vulgare]